MTGITPIYEGDEPCVTICDDGTVLVGRTVSSGEQYRTMQAYEDFREKEDLAYALARAEWVRTRFPSLPGPSASEPCAPAYSVATSQGRAD